MKAVLKCIKCGSSELQLLPDTALLKCKSCGNVSHNAKGIVNDMSGMTITVLKPFKGDFK